MQPAFSPLPIPRAGITPRITLIFAKRRFFLPPIMYHVILRELDKSHHPKITPPETRLYVLNLAVNVAYYYDSTLSPKTSPLPPNLTDYAWSYAVNHRPHLYNYQHPPSASPFSPPLTAQLASETYIVPSSQFLSFPVPNLP